MSGLGPMLPMIPTVVMSLIFNVINVNKKKLLYCLGHRSVTILKVGEVSAHHLFSGILHLLLTLLAMRLQMGDKESAALFSGLGHSIASRYIFFSYS